jgi:ATP phosphoribosyltransferase regulatory subunit
MKVRALQPLIDLLQTAGYAQADCALLQPADVFIDLSGEDIRRRLFITHDESGRELCLRPEFTIPLCLNRMDEIVSAPETKLSYCGTVFRQRKGESGEFVQAGVEALRQTNPTTSDADILKLALDAAAHLGQSQPIVKLGDLGILEAVLAALEAPPGYARRLKRRLASGVPVAEATLVPLGASAPHRYAGVIAALEGADPAAARAFVGDMMTMSEATAGGGRSVGEIADRFLLKAREGNSDVSADKRKLLVEVLSVEGAPRAVGETIDRLCRAAGLSLDTALDLHIRRIDAAEQRGVHLDAARFSAAFLRNLDYYTGLIFEFHAPGATSGKPLIGGGRYDGLMRKLGAARDVPAVGFSIWTERFTGMPS